MKRPYDLRHSGITWRLNSVGLEDVWIGRMDQSLHLEEP
jgi:hypothetical protein